MYLWFDYVSMPQPLADDKKKANEVTEFTAETTAPMMAHAGLKICDHRNVKDDCDLTKNLTLAVDSIPSYIERCAMMWVLVPPVMHSDLNDCMCDYNTWRQRGWVRHARWPGVRPPAGSPMLRSLLARSVAWSSPRPS